MPPALTVASLAVDGASYAATGKSVTDHALSAATGHDCALLRPVLHDKPVCDTAGARGRAVPVVSGHASVALPSTAPAAAPQAARDRYVTLGSFLKRRNAARTARRFADVKPEIVPVEVNGRRFHRVVVGPLTHDEAAALRARLAS